MYMAQYRRFPAYNSAVFNFVVDLNNADNFSGIRWYELRQTTDGAPWTIYQEGTYSQPDGHSAFCGNMCMDANGNIGMAYTTVSTTQFPSLRFTGRYASDPAGTMTLTEEVIANGTQSDPSSRYGDYAQMTIDPNDDVTFWSIGEYFNGGRKNQVGVFQIAPPALTSEFSATPATVCTGGNVTFTDLSLANPTTWNWSFPGGTPSSFSGQTPPPITYASAGIFDVTLTVSDGIDTDSQTKTGYITVKNLIADFSGSPSTVVVGNSVTFTDNSSCDPIEWNWLFTGGNPSTYYGQNPPPIVYNTTGTYDVSLTVSKPGGSETQTKTGYITVSPPLFNMSNGTITTCTGDFYDSGGSSASYVDNENFTLTFYPATPGAFVRVNFSSFNTELNYDYLKIYDGTDVSAALIGNYHGTASPGLISASNASGALTFKFTSDGSVVRDGWAATISCYSVTDPPVADFTASSTTTPVNSTITFTDQTSNLPTSWLWSFSPDHVIYVGGTNAGSQNPQVQFTANGQYTVTLTATNAYGSDTDIKSGFINVVSFEYCIPTYTTGTGYGDYITLVQLGSINNATGASANPYYTYFSNLSTDLNPGSVNTITLSPGTYGSGNYISVWIDYNQNGLFETSEKLGNVLIAPTPATGSIEFTVPENATPGATRMRVREVWNTADFDACSTNGYGETEDYNIYILSTDKILNLSVYFEGLYAGSGTMNQARNDSGPQFGADIADQITVELHNNLNYSIIEHSTPGVNLGTNGSASIAIPSVFNGDYYLTVKHRNSIETTSATPVSFAGPVIDYAFNSPSAAYGSNLLPMIDGQYVIYSGDVNQDGVIDTGDISPIDNDQLNYATGYIVSDVNGDGIIDTGDVTIVDNNQFGFVGSVLP
ncbi:MAG: PKD domain-containing protein [Bacteroidales bacterium]|nr:PKD domain-containing protein [Bacteroidales bacterium]